MCRAMFELGPPVRVTAGPTIEGRPTVEYLFRRASGTGYVDRHVALLQAHGPDIRILWRRQAAEYSSLPPHLIGPHADKGRVFRWKFSKNGRKIWVTGTYTVGDIVNRWEGIMTGKTKVLRPETYCYSSPKGRYLACA